MTPKFGENWLMKCIVVFNFWGASPPDPLTRGSAPGPRWPKTPIIGLRYSARHGPQMLKPNSAYVHNACIAVSWQVEDYRIEKRFLLFLSFNLLMASNTFDINLVV